MIANPRHPRVTGRPVTNHPASRRGVTMVLVLVTLATATILASAYLASRDNSTLIGRNVAASSAARWASNGGLDMATSIMETERDWRTGHTNGRLVDGMAIGQAIVDIDVLDAVTMEPPVASSEYIRVRSIATVGEVSEYMEALVHAPPAGEQTTVDIDLSEFAIAAIDSIELRERATVGSWPASPVAVFENSVNIATNSTVPGAVDVGADAAIIDATVWRPNGASAAVVSGEGAMPPDPSELPATMTALAPPPPTAAAPSGTNIGSHNIVTGIPTIGPEVRFEDATVTGTGTISILPTSSLVVDTDLTLLPGSRIVVNAPTTITVFGNFFADGAEVLLVGPAAELKVFVAGDMSFTDSYFGELDMDRPENVPQGTEAYMDPNRLKIYPIPSHNPSPDWNLDGTSVVKGIVYAPTTNSLRMDDTASVYGSVTTAMLSMRGDSAIFHDPALDGGQGYTNPDSLLVTDAATRAGVAGARSLGRADLQAVADTIPADVRAGNDEHVESPNVVDTPVPAGDTVTPTPRTQKLDVVPVESGLSVTDELEEPAAKATGRSRTPPGLNKPKPWD